jgi:hypothetical protein
VVGRNDQFETLTMRFGVKGFRLRICIEDEGSADGKETRQVYRAAALYPARRILPLIFRSSPLLTCSISLLPASSTFDPMAGVKW